jgi:hypothetical protein
VIGRFLGGVISVGLKGSPRSATTRLANMLNAVDVRNGGIHFVPVVVYPKAKIAKPYSRSTKEERKGSSAKRRFICASTSGCNQGRSVG